MNSIKTTEFKDRTVVSQQFKKNTSSVLYYERNETTIQINIKDNKKELVAVQVLIAKPSTEKVICNGRCTIVIMGDGSKGISRCNPNDIFSKQKGYEIAFKRAKIAQLEKELKELIDNVTNQK